ncbi:Uncharacterised protein [Mycobacterium tuberculosis]|nr:Uncharacterised protein [Mycobacterium tuberculosis]
MTALKPVVATILAIAPNAPIGASHSTITSTLNTSFCRFSTARRMDSPAGPRPWTAKPTSSATSNTCSTLPSVRAEGSDLGMICWMNPAIPCDSAAWPANAAPLPTAPGLRCRSLPGLSRLPTINPIPSATDDIVRK